MTTLQFYDPHTDEVHGHVKCGKNGVSTKDHAMKGLVQGWKKHHGGDPAEFVKHYAGWSNGYVSARPVWSNQTVAKFALPSIVKVGPHGYIHGWVYVGPKDDIGSAIHHEEHGHGLITAADKDSITVAHDNGQVKHYAATYAPQKPKFVKTGTLEGKTHIANVKADKKGVVTNNDDGKVVGHVGKANDDTWSFGHAETGAVQGGYASKHKAILGLITHNNAHADEQATHGVTSPVMDHSLSQGDETHATLTGSGVLTADDSYKNLGDVDASEMTASKKTVTHTGSGTILGHYALSHEHGKFTVTHADGTDLGMVSMPADAKHLISNHQHNEYGLSTLIHDEPASMSGDLPIPTKKVVPKPPTSAPGATLTHHDDDTSGNGIIATPSITTSTKDKQPYETIGKLDPYGVKAAFTSTGQNITTTDGVKVGLINFKPGTTQGYGSFTHADGETKPINAHTSLEAKTELTTYHNDKYGKVPETIDIEAKPTPWAKAGTKVMPSDLAVKKTGEVIHKPTGTQIGTIGKTDLGSWTGIHGDDHNLGKYGKKSDTVQAMANHHNQTTAIHQAVDLKSGGDLAKTPKVYGYNLKSDENGNLLNANDGDKKIGSVITNHDGTFTVSHEASGASYTHVGTAVSAKQSLVNAHNQAINRAKGTVPNPAASVTHAGAVTAAKDPVTTTASLLKSPHTTFSEPPNPAEINAMKKYTSSWYKPVNNKLRADKTLQSQKPSGIPGNLHDAIEKSTITKDMIVYRGVQDPNSFLGLPGEKVGKIFVDHGFTSTTTSHDVAKSWGYHGAVITIHAPAGIKGADIKAISHYGSEREILMQHGSAYRIDSDVLTNGTRHMVMTMILQPGGTSA